jgi:hypothetical protein
LYYSSKFWNVQQLTSGFHNIFFYFDAASTSTLLCTKPPFFKNAGLLYYIVEYRLGLKRKCIFQFSRKCENHAKMGRFSQNFTKFCFRKNFRKNLVSFSRKLKISIVAKIYAKISWNFRKNEKLRFSRKFSRKQKKRKCLQKSRNIFAITKTQIFAKIVAKISFIL